MEDFTVKVRVRTAFGTASFLEELVS